MEPCHWWHERGVDPLYDGSADERLFRALSRSPRPEELAPSIEEVVPMVGLLLREVLDLGPQGPAEVRGGVRDPFPEGEPGLERGRP